MIYFLLTYLFICLFIYFLFFFTFIFSSFYFYFLFIFIYTLFPYLSAQTKFSLLFLFYFSSSSNELSFAISSIFLLYFNLFIYILAFLSIYLSFFLSFFLSLFLSIHPFSNSFFFSFFLFIPSIIFGLRQPVPASPTSLPLLPSASASIATPSPAVQHLPLLAYRDMTDTLNTPVPRRSDNDENENDIYPSKLPNKIENLLKLKLNSTNFDMNMNSFQSPSLLSNASASDTINSSHTYGKEEHSFLKEEDENDIILSPNKTENNNFRSKSNIYKSGSMVRKKILLFFWIELCWVFVHNFIYLFFYFYSLLIFYFILFYFILFYK